MSEPRYNTFIPDFNFYQQTVKCQFACPVHTDARAYVTAIARGEDENAYLIARENNPFASTCGWVCGAPCEAACRRGDIDAPVAIRALKRFVNDKFGVFLGDNETPTETIDWRSYTKEAGEFDLGNSTFLHSRSRLQSASSSASRTGKRVAIVGSGPAGLTCAHDLALLGHEVTIFEASSLPGGMLRQGIPEYRLPRQLIDMEIQAILALGPQLKLNQALGEDFTLKDLRRDFNAVFIGIGTYHSRKLNIEGEQMDGVLRAVDFLINVNLGGYNLDLGEKIIVIGGGNVAMDVARTASRLGHPAQSGGDLEVALDVARTAVRLGTTKEVHCLVVEGRDEMLADAFEIEEAEREGVIIHNHVSPKQILGEANQAIGVQTMDVTRAFDDQGRFNPQLVPNSEKTLLASSVIVSIGQSGELDWVKAKDQIAVNAQGTIKVDRESLATTAEGVFAGGDIAFGPRLIINAVADGQRAAQGIHAYLQGVKARRERKGYFTVLAKRDYPDTGPMRGYLRNPRELPLSLAPSRRIGVEKVELSYGEEEAREQGARCLICTINPIFEGDLCVLCNGCVDVCPTNCLKLVPLDEVSGDQNIAAFVDHREQNGGAGSAMLFDPMFCIRCGLCAARCPTDAVKMETFRFTEETIFVKMEEVQ